MWHVSSINIDINLHEQFFDKFPSKNWESFSKQKPSHSIYTNSSLISFP